ncbi:MAG: hypothetical protein ACHQ4H_08530 [Ktedonobacterales bacterium]
MSLPRPPQRDHPRATVRLQDIVASDRERVFRASHGSDWAVLALLVAGLTGCGLFAWYRLGPQNDHVGRAIFFGTLLVCAYWAAAVYTLKLSLSVRVGSHGVSVVRGPWRTELPWREAARMTERAQVIGGERLRWVVLLAQDGRRLQIREDLVADYPRFRVEVFERYALWRDHGGTLGATGSGPFTTRELLSGQVGWWLMAALVLLLPGLYFALVLPETGLTGAGLMALAVVCALLSLRSLLRRHTFTIDAKAISARRPGRRTRLPWREVARIDRSRRRFNPVVALGIGVSRAAISVVTRTDPRVQIFDWRPRVPEYLTLRGGGHHMRIALHRLPRPDDLLAWIEFYESVGRKATREPSRYPEGAPVSSQPVREPPITDLSSPGGPADPWGAGAGTAFGAPESPATAAAGSPGAGIRPASLAGTDSWLRAEPDEHAPGGWTVPGEGAGEPDFEHASPTAHSAPLPPHVDRHPSAGAAPASARPATPWAGSVEQLWAPTGPVGEPLRDPGEPPPPAANWRDEPDMPDLPEEAEREQQPTDATENLAESFAPWRDDDAWQPPQLPRFGPSLAPPPNDEPAQPDNSGSFAQDDFLR